MILKYTQNNAVYLKLEDLFNSPYFSKGKFNFYITKQLEVQGFISTNYNNEKYYLEQNINSKIFNQLNIQDNSLYSFLRPNKKMSCYITIANIVYKLETSENQLDVNDYECLKELGVDMEEKQKQIQYLKKIINDKNYSDLLVQISLFKKKHIEYLADLNNAVNEGFVPYVEDINKHIQLEKNQNNGYDYFRIENNIEILKSIYEPFIPTQSIKTDSESSSNPPIKHNQNNLFDLLLIKNNFVDKNLSLNQIIYSLKSEYIADNDKIDIKKQKLKEYFQSILTINDKNPFLGEKLKRSIQLYIEKIDKNFNITDINTRIIELTDRINLAFDEKKNNLIQSISQTNCFLFLDYYNKNKFNEEDKKYMQQNFNIPISENTSDQEIKQNLYELIECSMTSSSNCSITTYDKDKNKIKTEIILSELKYSETNDAENLFKFFNNIKELPENLEDLFTKICSTEKGKLELNNLINFAIKNYDNYDNDMCDKKINELNLHKCLDNNNLTVSEIKGNKCQEYISVKPRHNIEFKTYLHSFFNNQYILYIKNKIQFSNEQMKGEEYSKILSILNYMSMFSSYSPKEIYKLTIKIHENLNKKKQIVDNAFKNNSDDILEFVKKFYNEEISKKQMDNLFSNKSYENLFSNKDNEKVKNYLYTLFDKLGLIGLDSDNINVQLYDNIHNNLHLLLDVPKYKLNFLNKPDKYGNNLRDKLVTAIKDLYNNFTVYRDPSNKIVVIQKRIDKKILEGHHAFTFLKSFLQIQNVIYGEVPSEINNKFLNGIDDNINSIFSSIDINDIQQLNSLYDNLNVIISKESDLKLDISQIFLNLNNQISKLDSVIKQIKEKDRSIDNLSISVTDGSLTQPETKSTVNNKIYGSAHQTIQEQGIESQNISQQQESQKLGVSQDQKLVVSQEQKLAITLNQKLAERQQQKQDNRSFEKNIEKLKNIWAPADLVRISDQGDYGIVDDSGSLVEPVDSLSEHETKSNIQNKQPEEVNDINLHLLDCDKVTFNHFKGKWYSIQDVKNITDLDKQDLYFMKCYKNDISLAMPKKYFIQLLDFLQRSTHTTALTLISSVVVLGGSILFNPAGIVGAAVSFASQANLAANIAAFTASITLFSSLFINYINQYNQKITDLNKSFNKNSAIGEDVELPELGDKPLKVSQLHDYAWIQFFCRKKLFTYMDNYISVVNTLCKFTPFCGDLKDLSISDTLLQRQNLDNICNSHLNGINPQYLELKDDGMDYKSFLKDIFNKDLIIKLLVLLKKIFSVDEDCRNTFKDICNKIDDLTQLNKSGFSKSMAVNDMLDGEESTEDIKDLENNIIITNGTKINGEIIQKLKDNNITNVQVKSIDKSQKFIKKMEELMEAIISNIKDSMSIKFDLNNFQRYKDYIGVFITFFRSFFDNIQEWDDIFELSDKNGIRSQFFGKPNLSPIAKAYELYVQNKKKGNIDKEEITYEDFNLLKNDKNLLIDNTNDNRSFGLFQQLLLKINDANTNVVDIRKKNILEEIVLNIQKYSNVNLDESIICLPEKKNELLLNLKNKKIINIDHTEETTDQQKKQILKCYNTIQNEIKEEIQSLIRTESKINIEEIIENFDLDGLTITKNIKFQDYFASEFLKLCPDAKKDMKQIKIIKTIDDFLQSIGIEEYRNCKFNTISLNILSKVFIRQYPQKIENTFNEFTDVHSKEFFKSLHIFYHKNVDKLGYLNSIVSLAEPTNEFKLKINENTFIEIPHPLLVPNDPNSSFFILNLLHNYHQLPDSLKEEIIKNKNLTASYLNAVKKTYNKFDNRKIKVLNKCVESGKNDIEKANSYLKCLREYYRDDLFILEEFNFDLNKNIKKSDREKHFEKLEIQHALNFFFHRELYNDIANGEDQIIQANSYLSSYLNSNYLQRNNLGTNNQLFNQNEKKKLFNMTKEHFIPVNHPYYKFLLTKIKFDDKTIKEEHKVFFNNYQEIGWYQEIKNWFNNIKEEEFKTNFNNYFRSQLKESLKEILNNKQKTNFPAKRCDENQLEQFEQIKNNIFFKLIQNVNKDNVTFYVGIRKLLLNITEANNDNVVEYNRENITILLNNMQITCDTLNQQFYDNREKEQTYVNINNFDVFKYIEDQEKIKYIDNTIFDNQGENIFFKKKPINDDFMTKIKFYFNFGNFIKPKNHEIDKSVTQFYENNHNILKNILDRSLNRDIKNKLKNVYNECYKIGNNKNSIDDILLKIDPEFTQPNNELNEKQIMYLLTHHKLIERMLINCWQFTQFNELHSNEFQQIFDAFKIELMSSFFINNIDLLRDDLIKYLDKKHNMADIKNCFFFRREYEIGNNEEIVNNYQNPKKEFKDLLLKNKDDFTLLDTNKFLEHINLFLCLTYDKQGNSYKDIIINSFFEKKNVPDYREIDGKGFNILKFNDVNYKRYFFYLKSIIHKIFYTKDQDAENNYNDIQEKLFYISEDNKKLIDDINDKITQLKDKHDESVNKLKQQIVDIKKDNQESDEESINQCLENNIFQEKNIENKKNLINLSMYYIPNINSYYLGCHPVDKDFFGEKLDTVLTFNAYSQTSGYDDFMKELLNPFFLKQISDKNQEIQAYYNNLVIYNNILSCFPEDTSDENIFDNRDIPKITRNNFKQINKDQLKKHYITKKKNIQEEITNNENNKNSFINLFIHSAYHWLDITLIEHKLPEENPIGKYFNGIKFDTNKLWSETRNRKWFNSKLSNMIKSFIHGDYIDMKLHSFFHMFNGNFYKYISLFNQKICKEINLFCSIKDKKIITLEELKKNDYIFNDITYKIKNYNNQQKSFTLIDKNENTIQKKFNELTDDTKNIYSEELMDLLKTKNLSSIDNFIDFNFDKFIDTLKNNNIIYNNEGPYSLKDEKFTCRNEIEIVDMLGNVKKVNLFQLIDENFGNVLSEYVNEYAYEKGVAKREFFGKATKDLIQTGIDYNKFNIDKNCNIQFTYKVKGGLLFLSDTEKKIPFNKTIYDIIRMSIDKKLKNFFSEFQSSNYHPDFIELFNYSHYIEKKRNKKIKPLIKETRTWLGLETDTKVGGAIIQQNFEKPTNEWISIQYNQEKINNEIDNLNDEEFINILNDSQNFKDKVNVEIMLNILENEII